MRYSQPVKATTWTVPGIVKRVVDADTLSIDLDLGWGTWKVGQRCRLLNVNAPERGTPEGEKAMDFVCNLLIGAIALQTPITFISKRLDQYGRPLGHVVLADGRDLGQILVDAGHAEVVAK